MRAASLWSLLLAFGCSSAAEQPSGGGSAGVSSAGSGGAVTNGGTVAQTNGGTAFAAGGSTAGMSTGGTPTSGTPTGGTPTGGATAGQGSVGGAKGGSAGANGGAPSGGANATGGSGGASGCVKNLACKLSPPPTTGDIYQDCVDRINQFLTQCACLPALTRRTDGEACANQMAEYDANQNSAHAGAIAKICQPGGSQNECPGYSSNSQVIGLCMQQMWDEGPPPTASCTGDCYETHGHFINMTDPSVTKVACGFFTTSAGKVWAAQNFSR
jgi:hypothetical protein